jgi:hypothetical protein
MYPHYQHRITTWINAFVRMIDDYSPSNGSGSMNSQVKEVVCSAISICIIPQTDVRSGRRNSLFLDYDFHKSDNILAEEQSPAQESPQAANQWSKRMENWDRAPLPPSLDIANSLAVPRASLKLWERYLNSFADTVYCPGHTS